MKILSVTTTLLFMLLSCNTAACDKVVDGYESKDTMYVVCPNFANLSNDQTSKLVLGVLAQYKGPPDEITVYFVANSAVAGKPESDMDEQELVGHFYTHNHELVILPNSKSLKRVVQLAWQ